MLEQLQGLTDEKGFPLGRTVRDKIERFLREPSPATWASINEQVLNHLGQTFSDCVKKVSDLPLAEVYQFPTKKKVSDPRNPDIVTAMRALNCAKSEANRQYFA